MLEQNEYERPATTSRALEESKQGRKQQFKLPKLSMPQSRGRLMSRKQNKAPAFLPSIHDEVRSDKDFRNTDTIHVSKSENYMMGSDENTVRDQFAYQIQQRLKMVVGASEGKQNQVENEQMAGDNNENISEDSDFEQKILQNKEIIKMHRKKTQLPNKKTARPLEVLERINELNKFKSNNNSTKPLSNYEKKMKDYNMSLENKYLQRKKESLGVIPEKVQQRPVQRAKSKKNLSLKHDLVEEAKMNFGYKQFNNPTNGNAIAKSQSKDGPRVANAIGANKGSSKQVSTVPSKPQAGKQVQTKTQQPTSPSKRINRTSALFDNIQTFLQNPIAGKKHERIYRQLYKKLKAKSIPQLEEKIKQIQDKLGSDLTGYQSKSTTAREDLLNKSREVLLTENVMDRTVRDWKRVDVKGRGNLHCQESNFQKELDYISYLQQKNSSSLTKFIDQQKLLVQLQIHRRIVKNINKEIPPTQIASTKCEPTELRQTNTGQQTT